MNNNIGCEWYIKTFIHYKIIPNLYEQNATQAHVQCSQSTNSVATKFFDVRYFTDGGKNCILLHDRMNCLATIIVNGNLCAIPIMWL
jgi:hypothetical protein